MTPEEYIKNVIRSAPEKYAYLTTTTVAEHLVHAAIGLTTESAGELLDAIKKSTIYGKELDEVNVKEELGDCLWYIALACYQLKCSFEELFDQNIAKLAIRYPDQFSEFSALNRDLIAERQALEETNTVKEDTTFDPATPSVAADLQVVSPRVGGAITRAYIRLNEKSPELGSEFLDPVAQIWYTYSGVAWVKSVRNADG